MGIVKMITKREIALIFYQIPSTYFKVNVWRRI